MKLSRKLFILTLIMTALTCLIFAFTGCKTASLARKLDMPQNVEVEIWHRPAGTTYMAIWDGVEGATGYEVSVEGDTFEVKDAKADITEYVTAGIYSYVYVTALGDGVKTADSNVNKAICRIENVSNVLVYKESEDKTHYSVASFAPEKQMLAGRIVIPDYHNGLPVTAIEESAFFDQTAGNPNPATGANCNNVTSSFRFPKYLDTIGAYAFAYCTIVKDFKLPDTVTTIGEGAFFNCMRLTTANIKNVNVIEAATFYECTALSTITLSDNIEKIGVDAFKNTALLNQSGSSDVVLNDTILLEVTDKEITKYTVSDSIKYISSSAFANCAKLVNVTIPDTVKIVGDYTFRGCAMLETITVPSATTKIPAFTFASCEALKNVTLPNGITSIGQQAFYNCPMLTEITLPETLTQLELGAFAQSGLISVNIPASVEVVGQQAFFACPELTQVTLNNGTKEIALGAFARCAKLEQIEIPGSVETIGREAFSSCGALHTVKLNEGLKTIGVMAFAYATKLNNLVIPEGVETIGYGVLGLAESVQYVIIPKSVKTIDAEAFILVGTTSTKFLYAGTYDDLANVSYVNSDGTPATAIKDVTFYIYSETMPTESGLYWHFVDGVPTSW